MLATKLYYTAKPLIPRWMQMVLRRNMSSRKRRLYNHIWPIDHAASMYEKGWSGWPDAKQFALVLTHDVETAIGHERCYDLMRLEQDMGFRSSFYFVPERYAVSPDLRHHMASSGFEVGLHGLYHDGKLFQSKATFLRRAQRINYYLENWKGVGFRAPAMHHNLDWIHELNIHYDASTFDTDPFQPYPNGTRTIFPFKVMGNSASKGYVELPYTLPQDFVLFSLLQETDIGIWQLKLDWIVKKGGMALVITHPDYMNFGNSKRRIDEYPVEYYIEFLNYIKLKYDGMYWHVLPREIAHFWSEEVASSHLKQVI